MLGAIFAREWQTLPRRPWHYLIRTASLTLLAVLGLTVWLTTLGGQRTITLGDAARFGAFVFDFYVYWVLLPLALFFGGIAAAAAVAQEKARRTFVILLITELRDHEIVLGKLAGSLLQLSILGVLTAPLLALLILLGGIAPGQVAECLLVLAASGLAAGSAGNLMALWREQTFPALALTVLALVLYLALVQLLILLPTDLAWLGVVFNPFEAMAIVLDASPSGPVAGVTGFLLWMILLTGALNFLATWRLRAWNPSIEESRHRQEPGEDERAPKMLPGSWRPIWTNPILWREIRTRAYGRWPLLVKLLYLLVVGIVVAYALRPWMQATTRPAFAAAYGLVPVTILSLMLVSVQSVTAITAERDRGTLDLLLVTDLSAGEFIFGKLGGILFNVKEYVLPPLLLAGVYGGIGWLATPPRGHPELAPAANATALASIVIGMLLLLAFVMVLGLHVGLRTEHSGLATSQTLATVFFLSAGTLFCIYLIVMASRFEEQWTSFMLFLSIGIGGLIWILNGERASMALTLAGGLCPPTMLYAVMTVLVGRPGLAESASPILPTLALTISFGFAIAAMLVPLLSEFDVALGRTGEQ